ncbi:hypothetical protein C8R44DRAFT_938745 [Mycena epipterygia]|nr:hypothetical protein C8R44DRAFT_938745 [Mycena epipterygia]
MLHRLQLHTAGATAAVLPFAPFARVLLLPAVFLATRGFAAGGEEAVFAEEDDLLRGLRRGGIFDERDLTPPTTPQRHQRRGHQIQHDIRAAEDASPHRRRVPHNTDENVPIPTATRALAGLKPAPSARREPAQSTRAPLRQLRPSQVLQALPNGLLTPPSRASKELHADTQASICARVPCHRPEITKTGLLRPAVVEVSLTGRPLWLRAVHIIQNPRDIIWISSP